MTIVVGLPLAWAAPMPEETRPSMPLAPRLLRKRASAPRGRERPPGLGSACSTRCRSGRHRGGRGRGRGEVRARSARRGSPAPLPAPRARPARRRATGPVPGRSSPSRAAQPEASSVGSARSSAAARRVGSFQPQLGSTTICVRTRGRQPGAQRLAGRHLAEAQDEVGPHRLAEALVAQQVVVGADDVGAVVGAAAQLRGRLGEDREAGGAGEVGERLAQLGIELAAGDDHAEVATRRCDRRPHRGGTARAPCRSGSPRSAAARRAPRAPAGRSPSPRPRPQPARVARATEVEVDGAGPGLAAGRRQRTAGDGAVVEQPVVVGIVRADFAEPAHGRRRRASPGRSSARRRCRAAREGGRR